MILNHERTLQTVAFIKTCFACGHLIARKRPLKAFGQATLSACGNYQEERPADRGLTGLTTLPLLGQPLSIEYCPPLIE
jgi:hypothetical protein